MTFGTARIAGLALALAGWTTPAVAQVDRFRYRPEIAAARTLYRYRKTNLDGSHAGIIAVFVASPDSLESFKYTEGGRDTEVSLVGAVMDWTTFSVKEFTSWRVRAGGERRVAATLRFDPGTRELTVALGGKTETTSIGTIPWHSFDFDFSSLNVAMRHLVNPRGQVTVGVADPTYRDQGPVFQDNGTVEVRYVGAERHGGTATRKYRIDGPGLRHRGGWLWVDAAKGHFVELAVHTGDEPGYDSVRLRYLDQRPMDRPGWDRFVRAQLGAGPPGR